MLEPHAVSSAREVIAHASDAIEDIHTGAMGLGFAADLAREVAELAATVPSPYQPRALAFSRACRAHCEQLEAGTGHRLFHARMAALCAWEAVDAAAGGAVSAGLMGDAVSDAASQAQNVADIERTLGPALDQADLQRAVQGYTGLNAAASSSLISTANSVLGGHAPSIATMTPLIAGALALANVGAPVIAVVVAAIALVPVVLQALGISSGPQSCTWRVPPGTGTCFNGTITFGPFDPQTGQPNPQWTTWAAWTQQVGPSVVGTTFRYYYLIAEELPVIDGVLSLFGPPSQIKAGGPAGHLSAGAAALTQAGPLVPVPPPPPTSGPKMMVPVPSTIAIWLFLRTYYSLLQANYERAINGHPYASEAQVLATMAEAWNSSHRDTIRYTFTPTTAQILPAQLVLQGQPSGRQAPGAPGVTVIDPDYPTFVSLVLSGQVDGYGAPPLTINIGDPIPVAGSGTAAASSGPSGVAVVATTAAVTVGAGALALSGVFGKGAAEIASKLVSGLFGGRR